MLYTHAGPEIGVASSKTFTATLVACYLLALWLGRRRGTLTAEDGRKHIQGLLELPRLMEQTLELEPKVGDAGAATSRATRTSSSSGAASTTRSRSRARSSSRSSPTSTPRATPAGEMKHGPIALIDDGMPVVALAPRDASYDRMMSNLEEVRARDGRVIAIGHEGDRELRRQGRRHASRCRPPPICSRPILMVIPLQLLAYHVAVRLGRDVDQPRNLAKSVTVE